MEKKHRETVDSKFKNGWQIISRMYNAEAMQHGGTISIGYFLLNIDSKDGSYASDIAPKLGMESTSLSRMIKTLETEKLIVRKVDTIDKRKVKLLLTEKGKENKELAKNIVRRFNRLIEEKIGKERIEDFFKTVNEITQIAEERHKLQKLVLCQS
ncbi:MAG: MarR family winged helix-turn-helix transcriptional regulator [Bacteroidota bacterium]